MQDEKKTQGYKALLSTLVVLQMRPSGSGSVTGATQGFKELTRVKATELAGTRLDAVS